MDQFWASAGLVALGATVSLGTTLIVELVKARRERERDTAAAARVLAAAEAQLERERIDRGRAHAKSIYDDLNELWARTVIRGEMTHDDPDARALMTRMHGTHLLIAEPQVRQSVMDALYGLGNVDHLEAIKLPREDSKHWNAVLLRARRVVAAHLRGDTPPADAIAFLEGVREFLDENVAWLPPDDDEDEES
jgi:hypothetical protein